MDLKQIRYFVAVADARSFTEAAEQLNITQPPLSRQIMHLESYLKVQLLKRDTRPLELTEAGRMFYEQSVQILRRLEQLETATAKLGQSYQQQLSIGFVVSTIYSGLPRLIRLLRRRYPDTRLQFVELNSAQQIEALKAGRIDIGFGRIRVHDPAIARITIREEPLVLAAPPGSDLPQHEDGVSLAALNGQNLIVYPSGCTPNFATFVLNALTDRGIEAAEIHEVQSLQTALGLVSAGVGYCLIPTEARIRSDLTYHSLTSSDMISSPIIYSYRKNDHSPLVRSIFDLIKDI